MINEESESVEPTRYPGQFRWICPQCEELILSYSAQTRDTRIDLHLQAHRRQGGALIQNPNVLTLTPEDIKFLTDAHIEAKP
jgi:hypothetical protein